VKHKNIEIGTKAALMPGGFLLRIFLLRIVLFLVLYQGKLTAH